jgi:two-component system response regulator YesN
MIKVMLVDDEPIILKGLRKLIPWAENGYEIIGEAFDGEDAMEMLETKEPDIIITDLLMPGMDGIEFIRRLNEMNKNIRVIILSGYGEFEYAREALKNRVFEYLLKPVTRQQLTDALHRVSEAILSEKNILGKLTGSRSNCWRVCRCCGKSSCWT